MAQMDTISSIMLYTAVSLVGGAASHYGLTKLRQPSLTPSNTTFLAAVANTHAAKGSAAWMTRAEIGTISDSKTKEIADATVDTWASGPAKAIWEHNPIAVAKFGAVHATAQSAFRLCYERQQHTTSRESLIAAHECSHVARAAMLNYMEEH